MIDGYKQMMNFERFRRIVWMLTIGSVALVLMCWWNPVNATLYRLGLLAGIIGVWVGVMLLLWKSKSGRLVWTAASLLLLMPFVLPGRVIDQEELRATYLKRIQALEGTPYLWGGESSRGIDCSGLPRKALRDSLLVIGLRTGNGDACRKFLKQWWFDTSAKALGDGYREFTQNLNQSGEIQTMPYDELKPGDIAVTKSGVHTLVYVGEGLWIQADPGIGAVATLDGRTDRNTWFTQPVTMHRWSVLAQ